MDEWAGKLKDKNGLDVFVSHGLSDMVLPAVAAGWLRELLNAHGAKVEVSRIMLCMEDVVYGLTGISTVSRARGWTRARPTECSQCLVSVY